MSRARSKTVDTAEVKKNGLPRRLNEKIALMKKKEQVQSQAFEQAMQSIFEMQQAQLHGGGGSMPSLQNIDSTTSPSTLQQMLQSFPDSSVDRAGNMTTPPGATHYQQRERPLSSGKANRSVTVERTLSDVEAGNLRLTLYQPSDNSWNIHKSESDLQQSLVTALQAPPFIHSQTPPTITTSTNSALNGNHTSTEQVFTAQNEYEMWRNNQYPRNHPGQTPGINSSSSVSAVLLSPDHTGGPGMTSNIDPAHIGSASSLPDLTNIEFSSGLDVPLEKDDDSPTYGATNPFHFPPPGLSKLALSSMIAPTGSPPSYGSHIDNRTSSDVRSHPYHQPHLLTGVGGSGGTVSRSPTMPEFRNHAQFSAPPVRKFKPPISTYHHGYQTPPSYNDSYMSMLSPPGKLQSFDGVFQNQSSVPPTLLNGSLFKVGGGGSYSSPPIQQPSIDHTHQHHHQVQPFLNTSPTSHTHNNAPNCPSNSVLPTLHVDSGLLQLGGDSQVPSSPVKPPSLASTASSGYVSLPPYLDPGAVMYQQRALQQRLASMSVFKDNPPLRSHSEENLMKVQNGSKSDGIIQQNPFMGNMSNASSVPCVYVESNSVEPCVDEFESYTTGTGSPSTSASHASSPPMHRPEWIEHPHAINEFVFQDWPLESGAVLPDKTKFGSPLAHHKSLTELNKIGGDYVSMELSPSSSNRAHQLSLPSIVMGDLIAMDEHNLEKQGSGPFLPSDFDMEEEVMETLLRNDDFTSFDMSGLMTAGASDSSSAVVLDSSHLYQHCTNDSMKY